MSEASQATTTETETLIGAVGWAVIFVAQAILVIFHTIKYIQDICTTERKSLSHRRKLPELNSGYKWMNILTVISIFIYLVFNSAGAWSFFSHNALWCDIVLTKMFVSIHVAKTFMYIVFLIRLYIVYKQSAFSYNKKCVNIFIVVIMVYGIFTWIIFVNAVTAYVDDHGDKAYPNYCWPASDNLFLMSYAMIVLEDLICSVGFLCAFIIPLRKTVKAVEESDNKGGSKITRKILSAGTKTLILTSTATISTLLLVGISVMTGIGLFAIPDAFINSVCMIFMTAYYDDARYYQRYCIICIKCCDRKGRSTNCKESDEGDLDYLEDEVNKEPTCTNVTYTINQSNETETTNASSKSKPDSVDTMSQLKVAAADIKMSYVPSNDTNPHLDAPLSDEIIEIP